jgi:hypothetical protein
MPIEKMIFALEEHEFNFFEPSAISAVDDFVCPRLIACL